MNRFSSRNKLSFSIVRLILHSFAILFIAILSGCSSSPESAATYLGNSNELDTLSTPDGFTISPAEADEIRVLRRGNSMVLHHLYFDDSCYYVCAGKAITNGLRINGKSGEVFNPETAKWEPRPIAPGSE